MLGLINWIKTSERLPLGEEQDNELIVSVSRLPDGSCPYVTVAFFTAGKGFWTNPGIVFPEGTINAWSFMPHPPRF